MNLPVLTTEPMYLAVLGGVLVAVLAGVLARWRSGRPATPWAVVVAALGALVCTAYSGDTSWNFARDHLGMTSSSERIMMFAAGELALFAMALMARANLNDPAKGEPGAPGVLVWVITGVQVIPAYSESGIVAGTVRAFVGPILAALLWHLAMGIELRHRGSASQSLPAVLGRELRERLLARLGLAQRGRDAQQISRDRWTRIATRRAARLADLKETNARPRRLARARSRLAAAVDRTDAAVLPEQRDVLRDRIAAYRHADGLAEVTLPSPWEPVTPASAPAEPEPVPAKPEYVPEPAPAVPEAVPAGVRLLPITARPKRRTYHLDAFSERLVPDEPPRVLAAEPPRTRSEVHAEYVPEEHEYDVPDPDDEPVDDSPPPPAEDNLTAQARADFADLFQSGSLPTYDALKSRYRIGQDRAKRIRDEFLQVHA